MRRRLASVACLLYLQRRQARSINLMAQIQSAQPRFKVSMQKHASVELDVTSDTDVSDAKAHLVVLSA